MLFKVSTHRTILGRTTERSYDHFLNVFSNGIGATFPIVLCWTFQIRVSPNHFHKISINNNNSHASISIHKGRFPMGLTVNLTVIRRDAIKPEDAEKRSSRPSIPEGVVIEKKVKKKSVTSSPDGTNSGDRFSTVSMKDVKDIDLIQPISSHSIASTVTGCSNDTNPASGMPEHEVDYPSENTSGQRRNEKTVLESSGEEKDSNPLETTYETASTEISVSDDKEQPAAQEQTSANATHDTAEGVDISMVDEIVQTSNEPEVVDEALQTNESGTSQAEVVIDNVSPEHEESATIGTRSEDGTEVLQDLEKAPSPEDPIQNKRYTMTLSSAGKYARKATFEDISSFSNVDNVTGDTLKDWLRNYLEQNFPEQLTKPNCTPRTAWIKDDPKKCVDVYKTYGWKPIKLNLQPGMIDIREEYTKEDVLLEQFEFDYSSDLETVLQERGDREVVSYLRKSKLTGHPLAMSMMKADSEITTEFRGVDSVVFRLGNNHTQATIDEETGDEIWRDTKKLRALLKDKPMPKKTGKGVTRTVEVLATESYLKARVFYKAFFTGTVTTDHGNEQFDGRRYWNWDLKYLLRYNNVPNAIVIYEDVELHFFSEVRLNMENEDWEWVNKGGKWIKQKTS